MKNVKKPKPKEKIVTIRSIIKDVTMETAPKIMPAVAIPLELSCFETPTIPRTIAVIEIRYIGLKHRNAIMPQTRDATAQPFDCF